jgi:hypothetical protein
MVAVIVSFTLEIAVLDTYINTAKVLRSNRRLRIMTHCLRLRIAVQRAKRTTGEDH